MQAGPTGLVRIRRTQTTPPHPPRGAGWGRRLGYSTTADQFRYTMQQTQQQYQTDRLQYTSPRGP